MWKKFSNNLSIIAVSVTIAFGGSAMAQESYKDTIIVGNVTLKPSLTTTVEYDDNIYTEDNGKASDVITRIKPEVTADSQSESSLVRLKLGAEQVVYADGSDDNYMNYDVSARMRLRPQSDLTWDNLVSYLHRHLRRGDNEADPAVNASEALPYDQYRLKTSLEKKFYDWRVQPRLGFTRYDYEDVSRIGGGMVDQDGRDRNEYMAGGRVGYSLQKTTELYLDGEYLPRDYDRSGIGERDSEGGGVLAGFRYRPSKEWLAEASAGYMYRDYSDRMYEDIDALDAHGLLTWNYDEGGRAQLKLDRAISEVTAVDVGGAVRTNLSLNVTRDLSGKLEGNVGVSYRNLAYEGGDADDGGDRSDDYYKLSAGLSYELTDYVALMVDYAYVANDSNRSQAEYDQNMVKTGIKLGF